MKIIIGVILLTIAVLYILIKFMPKKIRLAKYVCTKTEEKLIFVGGREASASVNMNTGKISYDPGRAARFDTETKDYAIFETITGEKKIEINTYKNEITANEGSIGTVTYNLAGRVHFKASKKQTEARQKFTLLQNNFNKLKSIFINWLSGFLSVTLINGLSIFIFRLVDYINTTYNDAIGNLPASGFYVFIPLALLFPVSIFAPFIAIPTVLYKLYDEYETPKLLISALMGFPVSYIICTVINNYFDALLHSHPFDNITKILVVGTLIVTAVFFMVLFLIKFFIKYIKKMYNSFFK